MLAYSSHSAGILFAYSTHTLLVCERHGKGEGKTWERFGKSKGIQIRENWKRSHKSGKNLQKIEVFARFRKSREDGTNVTDVKLIINVSSI